jgi:hypothetical protein
MPTYLDMIEVEVVRLALEIGKRPVLCLAEGLETMWLDSMAAAKHAVRQHRVSRQRLPTQGHADIG